MPRYKPAQRNGMFIPVVFDEQIQPGTFEFALHQLVDEELDLSFATGLTRLLGGMARGRCPCDRLQNCAFQRSWTPVSA